MSGTVNLGEMGRDPETSGVLDFLINALQLHPTHTHTISDPVTVFRGLFSIYFVIRSLIIEGGGIGSVNHDCRKKKQQVKRNE